MEPRRPSPALSAASSAASSIPSTSSAVRVLDAFHHANPDTVVTALAVDEGGRRIFIGERRERDERARPVAFIFFVAARVCDGCAPARPQHRDPSPEA